MSDIIAIANIALTLVVAIIAGIWAWRNNVDHIAKELREQIEQAEAQLDNRLYDLDKKVEGDIEKWTVRYGDSLMAIREKITQTELWNRDNFVSKQTFRTVIEDFKALVAETNKKIENGFGRLDRRLDRRLGEGGD